jgi:hypothetical protein
MVSNTEMNFLVIFKADKKKGAGLNFKPAPLVIILSATLRR